MYTFNRIYLLYTCDEWKTHESMRLLMASTTPEPINEEILNRIKSGDMEFDGKTGTFGVKLFKNSEGMGSLEALGMLKYGYLDNVADGKVE